MSVLDKSVADLKDFREKLKTASETNEDVKNNKSTPEKEQHEPEYLLYDGIAACSIQIMQNEKIVNTFEKISEKCGDEFAQSVAEAFVIGMTNSAFNAITLYDDFLANSLYPEINHMRELINGLTSDVAGYGGAIKVIKADIADIKKQAQISNLQK